MLRRFWEWLTRLWRPPPPPEPEFKDVSVVLEAGREALREWARNKLREDIIASLQNDQELPLGGLELPPPRIVHRISIPQPGPPA